MTKKSLFINVFRGIVLVSIMNLSMTSCKQNTEGNAQPTVKSTLTNPRTTSSTFYNPYEIVGIMHNQAMDYLILNKSTFLSGTTINGTAMRSVIANYYANNSYKLDSAFSITHNAAYDYYDSTVAFLNRNITIYPFNSLSLTTNINNLSISSETKNFALNILDTINSCTSSAQLTNKIKSLELQLNSNATMPTNEKSLMFAALAVCRYSGVYWENHPGPDGNGHNDMPSWQSVVRSDFSGALLGGMGGVISGISNGALIFGAGGIVLSAATGAVVGAITGSFDDFLIAWAFDSFGWLMS
jgi:hypothetical protein